MQPRAGAHMPCCLRRHAKLGFTPPRAGFCPERSIPVLLVTKKEPNPVRLEEGHIYCIVSAVFREELDQWDGSPDQPWPELQAKERWASPRLLVKGCARRSGLEYQESPKCGAWRVSLYN